MTSTLNVMEKLSKQEERELRDLVSITLDNVNHVTIQQVNGFAENFRKLWKNTWNLIIEEMNNFSCKMTYVDFYNRVKSLFKYVLKAIEKMLQEEKEEFLSVYSCCWLDYNTTVNSVNIIIEILKEKFEGSNLSDKLLSVDSLAYFLWKEMLLKPNERVLKKLIAKVILKSYSGKCTNEGRMTGILDCFLSLDATLKTPLRESFIYATYFEEIFLRMSQYFYGLLSPSNTPETDIWNYLSEHYLNNCTYSEQLWNLRTNTKKVLRQIIFEEVVQKRSDYMNKLMRNYWKNSKNRDINKVIKKLLRIYQDLGNFEKYHIQVYKILGSFIYEFCLSELSEKCQSAGMLPEIYVEAIIKIVNLIESNHLLKTFTIDSRHWIYIKAAFSSFINVNAITLNNGGGARSSELFAQYVDLRLKRSQGLPIENDETWRPFINVFQYLEEKDDFSRHYKTFLQNRLIKSSPTSLLTERTMICLLREQLYSNYFSVFWMMIKDVEKFHQLWMDSRYLVKAGQMTASLMVLCPRYWSSKPDRNLILPYELAESNKKLLEIYKNNPELHLERKSLSICFLSSHGEIITKYTAKQQCLHVTAYQIAILMLFNQADVYSVRQIRKLTNMNEKSLYINLGILVHEGVLEIVNEKALPQKHEIKYGLDTLIGLRLDYASHQDCIDLIWPTAQIDKEDEEKLSFAIQSYIIKTMKEHKSMSHIDLIDKTINGLSNEFTVFVRDVKANIRCLINRGIIAQSKEIYKYIA